MAAAAQTLRATPFAAEHLAGLRMLEVLDVQRRKIEDNPKAFGGYKGMADKVARSIMDRRIEDARDQLAELRASLDRREEELKTAAALQEQERLANARGQETITADDGNKTRDGYRWLRAKGKITGSRADAGDRMRDLFASATSSLRSCINDQPGGEGGDATPSAAYSAARFELDGVRLHLRASIGDARASYLYALMEAVCGRGETVRGLTAGKDREADKVIVELCCALDMAGVYLGMVRR